MPPVLKMVEKCLYPLLLHLYTVSICGRAVATDLGHCLLFLHVFYPCKDIWVKLADIHSRMPSLYMVVGSRLMLIEIVTVNWWKVPLIGGLNTGSLLLNS